ncbi:DUF1501 domain-containing protein [Calycomorphotria hydatis]|uniref:DUF1501 domain-containing protein n=1 Tax=Calycomorphotria hydatis TaxID=2528027 RepID=A0A517T542_9PLAN|nr:DUF1501 domain-containing protein [Calycomorphotria hydatis]QDT63490.1 hypothetical protein V22_07120 [Calycomorphotria hydatis]
MFDLKNLQDADRRSFLESAAKACLGVSILPMIGRKADAALKGSGEGSAEHVISLRMAGGMTHIDTFDPKPGKEEQGESGVVQTAIPGVQLGEYMEGMAKRSKDIAYVRGMYQETAAHDAASYWIQTGYQMINTIRHPSVGAWAEHFLGRKNTRLPGSVAIGGGEGAGYLPSKLSPVPIGSAASGLQNTKGPSYLDDRHFNRRLQLINTFDSQFQNKFQYPAVKGYSEFYDEAVSLLKSSDLAAFDINKEPESVREKYGKSSFGQGCLLARRLVEHGVRSVSVTFGGWDMHNNIFDSIGDRAGTLDHGFSTLFDDLKESGLLKKTLIVIYSEFGRSPQIHDVRGGRDHHPSAFTTVFAGAGIRGQVYGSSDEIGHFVDEDGVSVMDFNATIGHAMGLPIDQTIHSPSGRPFTMANDGEPITKLFS